MTCRSTVLAFFAIVGMGGQADACSYGFSAAEWARGERFSELPNCAFNSWFDPVHQVHSGEAFRLGPQTIGQRVDRRIYGTAEFLVVADCESQEVIAFEGKPSGGTVLDDGTIVHSSCDENTSDIGLLLAPTGPIRLTAQSTLDQLRSDADRNNVDYEFGPEAVTMKLPRNRAYDPFCGCKILWQSSEELRGG